MAWGRRALGAALLGSAVYAAPAAAHEVAASRFEAPIPIVLLYLGAALTVGLTAALLAVAGRREPPRHPTERELLPARVASPLRSTARVLFVVGVGVAVYRGLVGPQVRAGNVATILVWPLWFKGVAFLAAVVGSPWRTLSPWRALYAWATAAEPGEVALLEYPGGLGDWPAVGAFLAGLGVAANLTLAPRSPRTTAAIVAGYAALMLAGAVLFGPAWFRHADALEVLYRLFGRVAPFRLTRTPAGGVAVGLRAPWRGCVDPVEGIPAAAFVVAAVYTVSFDGFANTPEFRALLDAARGIAGPGPLAAVLLYAAGYVAFLLAFAAVATLSARATGWSLRRVVLALTPTVIPIAVAYEVAHYYTWVVANAGLLVEIGARALGLGVTVAPLTGLPLSAFWLSQVALIVGGHVVAVVAAHYALARAGDVARGHLPATALMVGYTVLSLWIVSRPVVA